jgi:acyl carrier protein
MLNHRLSSQDIERTIHEEILQILEEHEAHVTDISHEDTLHADLGLASLDLAQLVSILEMKLQADPFEQLISITDIRTVGDLCQAYQQILSGKTHAAADREELLASQQRAQARLDSRKA